MVCIISDNPRSNTVLYKKSQQRPYNVTYISRWFKMIFHSTAVVFLWKFIANKEKQITPQSEVITSYLHIITTYKPDMF